VTDYFLYEVGCEIKNETIGDRNVLKLRHILHPIRSAMSLYRMMNRYVYSYFAKRQFSNIRRGRRDRCWCGGGLVPFKWHPSYGICANCGCYVNWHPPLPEELKRLYSFDLYWRTRQRLKGHPTIEHRPVNDRSDGRVDFWLWLIERYGASAKRVVEVGCGSGVLLAELKSCGYKCIGVEPDEQTAKWVRQNMGLDVRPGIFPHVDLPKCDLFVALDVLEHSPNPEGFMRGAAELLNPGGVAIIQTPIDRYDYEPPFGNMFGKVFDDLEHLFIFSATSISRLVDTLELRPIANDQWCLAHEIVVFQRNG